MASFTANWAALFLQPNNVVRLLDVPPLSEF